MKLLSSLIIASSLLVAQNTFEKRFGGQGEDIGKAVLVLDDGYLVGGDTKSFGRVQSDSYFIKLNNNGNKVWSRAMGGDSEDTLEAILPIKDGFIFTGATKSFGDAISNLYVGRLSKDGQNEWMQGLYLDRNDHYAGFDLAKINDNYAMVAGSHKQSKLFSSNLDARLDAVGVDGDHTFGISFGGEDEEELRSIIKTADGYVLAGYTESYGKGNKDIYINRIDNDARRIWHRTFGFNEDETANEIIATKEGGFIVVGNTSSVPELSKQIYVVKMDSKGGKIWDGHYGYKSDEEGRGIIEVEDGYVIVGYTRSTDQRGADVYLLKLDRNGNRVWQRTYGGVEDDEGFAIAKTADGMIITGYTTDKDKDEEVYILKLDKHGKL
ncbi:MAG: hypothetical protein U9N52_03690 [Campylobacterota bacterium]|nr:hypothetical protein [Campylobacterota bacterium]